MHLRSQVGEPFFIFAQLFFLDAADLYRSESLSDENPFPDLLFKLLV
jgi:hypothetical protein